MGYVSGYVSGYVGICVGACVRVCARACVGVGVGVWGRGRAATRFEYEIATLREAQWTPMHTRARLALRGPPHRNAPNS